MQPVLLGLTFVDLNAAWIHNQWYSPKTKFQICEKVKFNYLSILMAMINLYSINPFNILTTVLLKAMLQLRRDYQSEWPL